MIIKGSELLARAAEVLTAGQADEHVLDLLARRSAHVLDSLNLERATTVGGVLKVPVSLSIGDESFTWGSGGDVDRDPPSEVRAWSYLDTAGQEISRASTPSTIDTDAYIASRRTYSTPQPDPLWLYWPRTLENGRYTFYLVPPTSRALTLFVYAFVPRLEKIEKGMDYELDRGVSSYLIYSLAIDSAPALDVQLSPEVYTAALSAADRIGKFAREEKVLQASPRWQIGNPHFGHRRRSFLGF